ncbi:hypothetical protein Goklo_029699, partial [Gossypium klotzschianum]|nr:hypothetical protein [Gossypium klotzschianum]
SSHGERSGKCSLNNEDIPKPKEFVGIRSACDVDNFLWRMKNYFRAKDIVDDAIKKEARAKLQGITHQGTVGEYVREFKELMLQVSEVTEEEALLTFQNGLKPWVRQEVEKRGVQKLSKAMTDHKKDIVDGNSNDDNGGNGKLRVWKKKSKRKRDKLKCFLCNGLHMLKKCPKKFALKEKPVDKALVFGSSTRGVEAKEAESEKKPVEYFLCHGSHRLRKCLRKSVIERNDGADKEPKKLGLSKGKVEAKRAKRSKKKRIKCLLCRGPHELRNYPKQAGVKRKATSELGESQRGFHPRKR